MNAFSHHSPFNRSRGVALITALLILTIATTAAAYLARQEHLSIRRAANVINGNEAYLAALQGEAMAMSLLHDDAADNNRDDLLEEWSKDHPPFPLEGGRGFVRGKVTDLQSRLNVNNLVQGGKIDGTAMARFQRLLSHLGIDPQTANAVVDWLDPDINPSGVYGAEDNYYLGLEDPYRCANSTLTDLSELRLIRGLRELPPAQFNQLTRHLTALRQPTPINVNTASETIWITTGMTPEQAAMATRRPELPTEEEAQQRGQTATGQNPQTQQAGGQQQPTAQQQQYPESATKPFDTIDQALAAAGIRGSADKTFDISYLSTQTNYFLLEIEAQVGNGRAVLKSVLYRNDKGMMQVVSRSQGNF